ncbi:MAG: hypothetical protein RM049_07665 [Nostoc sp. DedQUE04]|uniref:hypothetical protein n=1 Tax=Nostoc sp. DedQUE04 TaxID=3075390 RepID=UPI002AD4D582|nr:hypothetical protein [Nostoc sp. DedQUE04]MDZ8135168.1 hypothetical protein [Nostoc sp. DedQUE04]
MELIVFNFFLTVITWTLAWLIVEFFKKVLQQMQGYKAESSPQQQPKYSNTYLTNPRNRQLQAQLLQILQGDVSTAKQLLLQQRQWFPGRHDNWYLAKVIYNLENGIDELRDYEMYSRLLVMLQGDTAAAERLLMQQRQTYPSKHYGWHLEKIISDLERDRR